MQASRFAIVSLLLLGVVFTVDAAKPKPTRKPSSNPQATKQVFGLIGGGVVLSPPTPRSASMRQEQYLC